MTNIVPFRRRRAITPASRRGSRGFTGDLTGALAGRQPHDFCLHLVFTGELGISVASAPIWCRDRIAEAGFPSGPAVILFSGRDLDGAAAFATIATADWKSAVLRLCTMPSYAFAERMLLLFWTGALRPRARRAMSAEIGRRIASYGNARWLGRIATTQPVHGPDLDTGALTAFVVAAATLTDMLDGSSL
ncbi:hypothetical protein ABIE45_006271 [Methylobacterium sp. OAE515]|uniref:hypothetical protein n=1 Tax=Methylobacterium sp. OAE515 TaxID=2817895 RepID=UPI00178B7EB0